MARYATTAAALRYLRSARAVRERSALVLARAEADGLAHFVYHPDLLAPTAAYVAEEIRARYPDLAVPFHSRWRHFETGGVDRAARIGAAIPDEAERTRCLVELAITSVFLDAGSGPAWSYDEPETGARLERSEGLAVASFHAFTAGLFSSDPARPLRADAAGLGGVTEAALAAAFQAGPGNPLAGLAGRAALMRRLGEAVAAQPALFGRHAPRLGGLYDHLTARAERTGRLSASRLLATVLGAFAAIWPGRLALDGHNLGDVWHHSAAATDDRTSALVPFHKLSQWLTYSLIEPLEAAGIRIVGLDGLTGLAEYRNGGLLVDLGVLVPRPGALGPAPLALASEAVVEWRALTVALLDRLAPVVRGALGVSAAAMPLARLLEGGTWHAGRRIARERRADGVPAISVASDGTVF